MTIELQRRAEAIFKAAVGCDSGERAALLDHECADDPSLRNEVEALLAADAGAANFLHRRDAPGAPGLGPGQRIGRYRLTRLIGAGGMGAVFEAEQDQPRRTVALKIMKSGFVSDTALRRFDLEAAARPAAPGHCPGV